MSFKARQNHPLIVGHSHDQWISKVIEYLQVLESWQSKYCSPRVMLLQHDPIDLLAGFMAAAIAHCPVFLGNPNWTEPERTRAKAIANPHIIWSDHDPEYYPEEPDDPQEAGWIMIPTGGTSGQIKFTIHTWSTLSAAVAGLQAFFFGDELRPIHSCCVLPMYHVSGLMQFMRSLLTGADLVIMPFKDFLDGKHPDPSLEQFLSPDSQSNQDFFLSFVPTQLSRVINTCQAHSSKRLLWLKQFQAILLGGAPASSALLAQARDLQFNLAPCYGMTETAAQVMTLHPQDFLAGQSPPGQVLPHVRMELIGSSLQTNLGQLQWSGPSICRGYYPHVTEADQFLTDDIAEWTPAGRLNLKGRASRKILSGGENIYPEEIEAVLMAMTEIKDACIFGMPDEDWGEIAIAAYVPTHTALPEEFLRQTVKASLASYKCPKCWWLCAEIPRNAQGKVALSQLKQNWQVGIG